ncbi:hypothetical protein M885DRAFT_509846 [Pelagophyceae sp. CCMP2097]|nr:hypothetical protein M885DRAFT_509846 [Pelagophyceae sp. CCMP2097]
MPEGGRLPRGRARAADARRAHRGGGAAVPHAGRRVVPEPAPQVGPGDGPARRGGGRVPRGVEARARLWQRARRRDTPAPRGGVGGKRQRPPCLCRRHGAQGRRRALRAQHDAHGRHLCAPPRRLVRRRLRAGDRGRRAQPLELRARRRSRGAQGRRRKRQRRRRPRRSRVACDGRRARPPNGSRAHRRPVRAVTVQRTCRPSSPVPGSHRALPPLMP